MSHDPDGITLVCAPANTRTVSRGTVFTHQCAKCHQHVAMAPSGQRTLREHPEAAIICMYCLDPDTLVKLVGGTVELMTSAASVDELRAELSSTEPNTWAQRN